MTPAPPAGRIAVVEKRNYRAAGLPAEGRRLDAYLADLAGMPTRTQLKRLIEAGRVKLNGQTAKASARVRTGDRVEAELPDPTPAAAPPENIALEILYEDSHLVVLNKPAGLLVHPYPGRLTGTLVNALLHHCRDLSGVGGELKPGIVHRLDKLTSGVMVAAKTDAAHLGLARQFKEHSIARAYLALVHGRLEREQGTYQSVIGRNPHHRLKMSGRTGRGKAAVTHYRVRTRFPGFTLSECRLETGRTHQIRVHFSEAGHPLVGDPLYHRGRNLPARLGPRARALLEHWKRQALHAYLLGFRHPHDGRYLEFSAAPPADFQAVLAALAESDR